MTECARFVNPVVMRSAAPPTATHPAFILLVDDNPQGMLARSAVLRGLGYQVSTAASGEEALALSAAQAFDLVVTDFRMPQMDGMQLIAVLRERGFAKPVILLSGFANKLGFDEKSTGADLVIQKSDNEAITLMNGVKRLLSGSRKPPSRAAGDTRKRAARVE